MAKDIQAKKQEAQELNSKATCELERLGNILNHTLNIDHTVDWECLKDKTKFNQPEPKLIKPIAPTYEQEPEKPMRRLYPQKPTLKEKPICPDKNSSKFQPKLNFLETTLPLLKYGKIKDADDYFAHEYDVWTEECKQIDAYNADQINQYEQRISYIESKFSSDLQEYEQIIKSIEKANEEKQTQWLKQCEIKNQEFSDELKSWEEKKEKFLENQRKINEAIDKNRQDYFNLKPGAITDYCEMVLSNSQYPDYFPKKWDIDYNFETKTLVVEYLLPAPEHLPTLKSVQYVQARNEMKETHLTSKEKEELYDILLYQIALRTIHELFEADAAFALERVSFNGIVTALDAATGHNVTACLLSVIANKETFVQINLSKVDPKACFKKLKGVSAAKLTGLAPVAPIMSIDKTDRRFVQSYAVAESLDSSTNLATMNWEDFEHLIREVFELEFGTGGGEVKVTQASRDGGVDAVAFDPDPIRGGKIVIQAKRYNNTVGVSAVRDLYGTVQSEGAMKGILVTTSDYGPDSYEFVNGKPLTLMNGSQLLWLLEKHGHKARINLKELK